LASQRPAENLTSLPFLPRPEVPPRRAYQTEGIEGADQLFRMAGSAGVPTRYRGQFVRVASSFPTMADQRRCVHPPGRRKARLASANRAFDVTIRPEGRRPRSVGGGGGRSGRELTAGIARLRSRGGRQARTTTGTGDPGLGLRRGDQALADSGLAGLLAGAADSLGLLAGAADGGLLIRLALLHLAEDAFALHLLLEDAESLVDVVVANEYLQRNRSFGP